MLTSVSSLTPLKYICNALSSSDIEDGNIPVIAGGLIETEKEVEEAILNGAIAISTGQKEFWE